jgi:hypothetical protein
VICCVGVVKILLLVIVGILGATGAVSIDLTVRSMGLDILHNESL